MGSLGNAGNGDGELLSPKEVRALRRSGGGAAVTAARAKRGLPETTSGSASGNSSRVIELVASSQTEDELVPRSPIPAPAPAPAPAAASAGAVRAGAYQKVGHTAVEPLRGVAEFVVTRHNKGSYSLHQLLATDYCADEGGSGSERVFLLAARAEGGGVSSFLRLYTEPAVSGMTPGKAAASYVGKLTSGSSAALWYQLRPGFPAVATNPRSSPSTSPLTSSVCVRTAGCGAIRIAGVVAVQLLHT